MNIQRGVTYTLVFSLIGFLAPILVLHFSAAIASLFSQQAAIYWNFNRYWWVERCPLLLFVTTIYSALAALATYLPRQRFPFWRTLLTHFQFGLPVSLFLLFAGMSRVGRKGIDHPFLYPSEYVAWVLPPLTVCVVLLVIRCRNSETVIEQTTITAQSS